MSAEVIKLKYLQYIVEALRLLYKNDRILFDKKTHEMTYEFRIANYLAQQLENEYPGMKIDCEYHSQSNQMMATNMVHRPIESDRISYFMIDARITFFV